VFTQDNNERVVLDGISSIYYALDSSKGDDVQFRTNAFDIWVFRRDPDAVRYLLLHTSQEKADRWFNGGCFWQIPGDFVAENESIVAASRRCLAQFGITASSLWAVEHTYTIYNRRRENIELILVLAAEAQHADTVTLTWEHSEYRWSTATESQEFLRFRGLLDGLQWTRRYVTEPDRSYPELKLA
jgi:ADP-ribose pyrophosphatase YjhB (NUDIX family)